MEKEMKAPNPSKHLHISLFKSGARIFGFALLLTPQFVFGVLILILAEVLGIAEEFV